MPRTLTGPAIGFPLQIQPDHNGELHFPTLEQSVRQSIEVILRTRPREQLMRPAFGAGLLNYCHEPNTITARRQIHDTIRESLQKWEPRIRIDRLDVAEVADDPGRLRIHMAYRIVRTGAAQSLGVTLKLSD